MRTRIRIGLALLYALTSWLTVQPSLAEFAKPATEQLRAAAGKPSLLPPLLRDANPEQAAHVLAMAIEEVRLQKVPEDLKLDRVALLTGYAFATLHDQSQALAQAVIQFVFAPYLPTVAAAAVIVCGDQAVPLLEILAPPGSPNAEAIRQAAANPEQNVGSVSEDLGTIAIAQYTPPAFSEGHLPTALPIAPPITPFDAAHGLTPPLPPVVEPYSGQ